MFKNWIYHALVGVYICIYRATIYFSSAKSKRTISNPLVNLRYSLLNVTTVLKHMIDQSEEKILITECSKAFVASNEP